MTEDHDNMLTLKPYDRLELWLEENKSLPEIARTALENFILSCEKPTEDDLENFLFIDIEHFPPTVKMMLVDGLFTSYGPEMMLLAKRYVEEQANHAYRSSPREISTTSHFERIILPPDPHSN